MPNQLSHFEDILLPPSILAGLYSQSLVVIEKTHSKHTLVTKIPASSADIPEDLIPDETGPVIATAAVVQPVNSFRSLGDFGHNILVLVNDETSLHLAESELETLGKMLSALKRSFADIALVNVNRQDVNWQALQAQFPASRVMLFGVDPTQIRIPVRFPDFRVQTWNETRFLYSPSLREINRPSPEQIQLKKSLWTATQELFTS